MTDNMKLWNTVAKTDPKDTKRVKIGREFTAISPHSQIKAATAQFGAVGVGWGWTAERIEYLPNDTVAVLVRLWHGTKDHYFEQWGQNGIYTNNAKDKDDQDCMKKATTDGVTKCLSYLGFNADVFEGKFDDNRYVEQAEREARKAEEKANWTGPLIKTKLMAAIKALVSDINDCTDEPSLEGLLNDNINVVNQCKVDLPIWYNGKDDIKGLDETISEKGKALLAEGVA